MKQLINTNSKDCLFRMLRISILIFVFLATAFYANAQKGKIQGMVIDKNTKENILFANVLYEKSGVSSKVYKAEFKGGTVSNDGGYEFELPIGKYNIYSTIIAYDTARVDSVEVFADSITIVDLQMKASVVVLNMVEINAIPSISGEADVACFSVSKSSSRRPHKRKSKRSKEMSMAAGLGSVASRSSSTVVVDGDVVSLVFSGTPAKYGDAVGGVKSSKVTNAGSGVLTAGEIHDFSKWELWQDIAENDLVKWQKYWKFSPLKRFSVQLTTDRARPLIDCEVRLLDGKDVVWIARTDNTGKAELWAEMFDEELKASMSRYSVEVIFNGKTFTDKSVTEFSQGINVMMIPAECYVSDVMDVMFVVDATGSMEDEIDYLKAELNDVISKVKDNHSDLTINMGSVFYRDKGDKYILRKSDFSTKISKTIDFIKAQSANGGGDTPEALDTAMDVAINGMKWSEQARARLLFIVLDAPPHYSPEILNQLHELSKTAAEKGIRIVPLSGSGIDKSTEYLMRCFALATNGTYAFLTDHSGIGNPHIEPTTDKYDMELLNDLLIRLFDQYTDVLKCEEEFPEDKIDPKDTIFVIILNNPVFTR